MTTALLPARPAPTAAEARYVVLGELLPEFGMPWMRLVAARVDALTANDNNARTELELDAPFLHSIRVRGVHTPLQVEEWPDGTLKVIMGHRRLAAAKLVGRTHVPCILVAPGDAGAQFLDMVTENQFRVGLKPLEEAGALFAAHQAGMPVKEIRRRLGRTAAQFKAAITAHTISPAGREAVAATGFPFDLAELAALAEFDGDTRALAIITREAARGLFQYGIELARTHRQNAANVARATAELTAAGVHISTEHLYYDQQLTHLGTREAALTVEEHASCPGHTAQVDGAGNVTFYCSDPKLYKHAKRTNGYNSRVLAADKTPEARAADTLERRTVRGGNVAWAAATAARHVFLTGLFARPDPPAGTARFLAHTQLTNPGHVVLHAHSAALPLLADFLALPRDGDVVAAAVAALKRGTDKRVPLVQLAIIAASCEESIDEFTWRTSRLSNFSHVAAGEYFTFLSSAGHTLTPIEQSVADQVPYRLDMENPDDAATAAAA